MRRLSRTSLALLAAALLVASGCASPAGRPSGRVASPGLAQIVKRGELRVGMSGAQPPLNMTARTGELMGLEVALARTLAANMGVRASFVTRPFARLLDALEAGEVDLVMSGMTITPKRNLRAAFVGPYFVSGKSVLTRSEVLLAVQDPATLNQPTFRFAALEGSTSELFVRRVTPKATLVTTETLDEGVARVIAGTVDALVADFETCALAVLRNPEAGLATLETPLTVEPIGIAVRPDDPLLVNLLDNYLTALEATGSLDRARNYWFEDPSWLRALP